MTSPDAREPEVDEDDAGWGLLLQVPATVTAEQVEAALAVPGTAAVILDPRHPQGPAIRDACLGRCACVVAAEVAAVGRLQADGVMLNRPEAVAAARAALGARALIGAACGASRHALMVAGEDGADYVMVSPSTGEPDDNLHDLCAWWSGLFVLPIAADARQGGTDVERLAAAGADFLMTGDAVWSAASPADAITDLMAALARGRALRPKD